MYVCIEPVPVRPSLCIIIGGAEIWGVGWVGGLGACLSRRVHICAPHFLSSVAASVTVRII